ncbi:hypothetical protein [Phocaeicola barnesiae]|uniref:hypothetical protein n=1 Tax=Phocaeicola barnesiae TaxID=376804 RepID=UPI00241E9D87|nr:hypothetical protein [Phocaeicola barnesiae]
MKKIMKVVMQGEPFAVQSQKAEGGQLMKCNIVLQELGGKYEDSYVAAMLGALATCRFYAGDLVYAVLRFQTREYNGQVFQDILVQDLVKINSIK